MRQPEWIRKQVAFTSPAHEMKKKLRRQGLHTVCEEARCPNQKECFGLRTATFMIMGNICTRSCGFCAVSSGNPRPLDPHEPQKIAKEILELNLKHAVITSVTRDDLADGGASHFALTVAAIHKFNPTSSVEVLTPDFLGNLDSLKRVLQAKPDVFNHNIETVERLTPLIRSRAQYQRSLAVLKQAADYAKERKLKLKIKSGFMLGFGETDQEIKAAIGDLKEAGCSVITIGQYLRPSKTALPVQEYIRPEKFESYKEYGQGIGVQNMFCGPLIRSSYRAEKLV